MSAFFVAGTDTDVGKSFVSALIASHLSQHTPVTYFKPVQAGAPTDFDYIKTLCNKKVSIKQTSYCLKEPMSPNRAAVLEDETIEISKILDDWQQRDNSFHIIEGAGGLLVPLNSNETIVDLLDQLRVPCLLVASTKLGTINHTLLSVEALKRRGITCLGIVLNGSADPGLAETIEEACGVPILFQVPKFKEVSEESIKAFDDNKFKKFIENCLQDSELGSVEKYHRSLEKKDKDYVWHPFTQHGIVKHHPLVTKAKGSYLWLGDKQVIDGISSWWVNLMGHCHPEISEVLTQQAHSLEHVIFAGFTHEPAIELSERLVNLTKRTGAALDKVFFSDNGSTAIEVALKMAFQYFQQNHQPEKKRFLAFHGSYHGDTLGAMSVGERKGFNEVFNPLMFDVDFVDPFDKCAVEQALDTNPDTLAAIILEPMVQGASGMRMYPPEVLNLIAEKTKDTDTFVICDEVFTGFYRTGKMFAYEHTELKPDFLCLSKGLTGGYLPLSVTLTTNKVFDFFKNDNMKNAFLHGHSYTANPLACKVATKTLEILERPETIKKIQKIEESTSQLLSLLSQNPAVHNVRQLGTIGAMEIGDEDPNYFKGDFSYRFNQKAIENGVLLRPLGGTVYSVPPYCIEDHELEKVYMTIDKILKEEM